MDTKVLTADVWERHIHMFDDLGMAVYETIARVTVEARVEQKARDNGCVEAVLDLRVIEEQLRQLTYAVHDLMEENQLESDAQKDVSRSWVEEIRTAVAPLVNRRPEEILKRHRPWEL